MNTIAIIENNRAHFNSVKKMFKANNVWPDQFEDLWKTIKVKESSQSLLEYEDQLVSGIFEQISANINKISAIIMDISLYTDNKDESGIKIIRSIRDQKDAQFKLIPIFCYTIHGKTPEMREKALAAGATNIFDKQDIDNNGKVAQMKIEEFQITMRAQMVAYEVSMMEISALHGIKNIENALTDIRNTQIEDSGKLNITTEMLLSMISSSDLESITNDEEKQRLIEKILGGEKQLEQIRQKMAQLENKNNQVELLDYISDALCSVPGINVVFPLVFKVIKMIRKHID